MNNNQSLREFLGGQAANKVDNSTDGQQMKETFQDNYFCCFRQFRLILSGKNRIFCTAGFALSGVQGACQSGLPAEKIESLLWTQLLEFVFYWSLSLLQALGSAAVFLAIDLVFFCFFLDLFFSINLGRVPKTLGSHMYHPYSGLWSFRLSGGFLFLIASWRNGQFQRTIFNNLISREAHFSTSCDFAGVFFIASSHNVPCEDTLNVSSGRQFADSVSGKHKLPSWFDTSSTVNLRSDNRWQRQMAFCERVCTFEVREDTAPGEWKVQESSSYHWCYYDLS